VVHATNPHDGVVVSSLSERYWSARYVGARRVL
jgi:cell wall-associated NlpC family hydrolase